ncbi:MAG: hypothetical protein JSU63_08245 [Phycisphaerales bacterium]|nr:MAG: hypothetical protein JSU63_08245 [Phycisphaerales bacterium]
MIEEPYNPNDPLFLASRSLDEDLSESERQRLEDALADSESLRAEVEKLRQVDHLVRRVADNEVELDWDAHARLIRAKVLDGRDTEREKKLDALLAHWGGVEVGVDKRAFTAAVVRKIGVPTRRPGRRSLIFRLGVPLAAAVAIALAFTGVFRSGSSIGPISEVSISRFAMVTPAGGSESTSIVSFGRQPAESYVPESTTPGISFIVLGASPMPEDYMEEAPPL